MIESDTGFKLFDESMKKDIGKKEVENNRNLTPTATTTKPNIKHQSKMSDTPVSNTRSEKIKSTDSDAANKNNHQQCSAPNNSANKPVIYLYFFFSSPRINMVYHIDFFR